METLRLRLKPQCRYQIGYLLLKVSRLRRCLSLLDFRIKLNRAFACSIPNVGDHSP